MAKRPLEPVTYWRRRTVSLLSEIKACRLFVYWRNFKQYDFFYGMGLNITTIILQKLTSCNQPLIGGRFRNIYFEKLKQWKNMTRCWTQLDIITLVRHKKARFDSKMHGSTEKSPVRQKNARFDRKMPSPECISWHCHYQTSPTPPPLRNIFFQFFSHIFFNNQ